MKESILLSANQVVTASLLLFVLAGGCTAPRQIGMADVVETTTTGSRGVAPVLSRTAEIVQLQVDASGVYAGMIEYFTPESGSTLAVSPVAVERRMATRRLDAYLRFKPGSSELLAGYGGNRNELARIKRELSALTAGKTGDIESIRISGYASPDGNTSKNEELAAARALRYRNYLERELRPADQDMLQVDLCAEDWQGLAKLVQSENKPYASRVVAVLDSVSDPDRRRKALRDLNKGAAWNDMEKTLFSRLRRMQLDVTYRVPEEVRIEKNAVSLVTLPGIAQLVPRLESAPESLTLDELLQVAVAYRSGTEQYREVYELAAYRFPDCSVAQLNAAAAALSQGDREAARYFLSCMSEDPRSWINQGVLSLMDGNAAEAAGYFRKSMPRKPRLARENLTVVTRIMNQE